MTSATSTLPQSASDDHSSTEAAAAPAENQPAVEPKTPSPKRDNEAREPSEGNEEVAQDTCPKCLGETQWEKSSWCVHCGYYPGVSEICPSHIDEVSPADTDVESSAPEVEPPLIAPWVVQLTAYNTALFVASIGARYYFEYFDSSYRGMTGFVLLLVGIVTLCVNHLRAAMDAMQQNCEVGPFDIVGTPIEMWRSTIQGLPKSAGKIIWATMGVSAMICGGVVIGGIDVSDAFKHEKPKHKKPDVLKDIVSNAVANAPQEDQPESLEEALEQVADLEPVVEIPMPEPGDPITCVIYGFLKDGEEDFGRILLAGEIGGKRRHVATLPASVFPQSTRETIAARLTSMVVEKTSVTTRYHATWVRPTIGLRVEFSGWSSSGEMKDPTLVTRAAKTPAPTP